MDIPSLPISKWHRPLVALALVLLATTVGCNRGVTLIPVRGEVRCDGRPVADCAVLFAPVAGGPVAAGTTDSAGQFELRAINRPGAVPGEHRVTITKRRIVGLVGDLPGGNGLQIEWLLPEKYSRPESSGLRKTVGPGQDYFLFELRSKEK